MARPTLVFLAALLLIPAAGCGFLDDDVLLSDEEFEASFGAGGLHTGGYGSGRGSSYGCGGIGYGHHSVSSHINLGAMHFYAPSVHNAPYDPAPGVSGTAPAGAGDAHLVWHRDEQANDQQDTLLNGKFETWGDYLEASIIYAQGRNR